MRSAFRRRCHQSRASSRSSSPSRSRAVSSQALGSTSLSRSANRMTGNVAPVATWCRAWSGAPQHQGDEPELGHAVEPGHGSGQGLEPGVLDRAPRGGSPPSPGRGLHVCRAAVRRQSGQQQKPRAMRRRSSSSANDAIGPTTSPVLDRHVPHQLGDPLTGERRAQGDVQRQHRGGRHRAIHVAPRCSSTQVAATAGTTIPRLSAATSTSVL